MYEDHRGGNVGGGEKSQDDDNDDDSSTITVTPNLLANLLTTSSSSDESGDGTMRHYYWTSPVAEAAPQLSTSLNRHANLLHEPADHPFLDPRGPSLWMGTSGSGTQCHYDVANNAILQLHGTKRVRVWRPSVGVHRLHVYPDAHPRARKSQVDFDVNVNDNTGDIRRRYSQYYTTTPPRPTLDVVLRPGDALYLPAFWFHHVENGRIPVLHDGSDAFDVIDGPSLSLNSFTLSEPMMTARRIFASASRPLGWKAFDDDDDVERRRRRVVAALGALGVKLIRELNVVEHGEELGFIRKYLFKARYSPLIVDDDNRTTTATNESLKRNNFEDCHLTTQQMHAIDLCIERILPDFRHLLVGSGTKDTARIEVEGVTNNNDDRDGVGIVLLVGLHLLELWAVEMVGPGLVAEAWDNVLSCND